MKFFYYFINTCKLIIPNIIYRLIAKIEKKAIDDFSVVQRVLYYNKIDNDFVLENSNQTISQFKKHKKNTYFFDLYEYLRYFDSSFRISYLFGDVTHVPDIPTIVKSRPIDGDNSNSILMNLNKVRHFVFIKDKIRFEDKKNMVVWRGGAYREPRKYFVQKFYDIPLGDIGQTNKPAQDVPWQKAKMTINEQLKYKFILSIEGNDVATNLKWIMSSNSLAFMTKPKYETWFMEGTLIPDFHYVLLKNDYSDLEEKIRYYSEHLDEGLEIIKNANEYCRQFQDQKNEDFISIMVLDKYFRLSGQIKG